MASTFNLRRRALMLTGAILIALGLVPGMPWVFLVMGGAVVLWGRRVIEPVQAGVTADGVTKPPMSALRKEGPEDVLPLDLLTLEVGYELVPLVDADRATAQGLTVVDPATVMATHLGELIRAGAPELLWRREVEQLLEGFAKTQPKIVEELVPGMLSVGDVAEVLRNLLREGLSIRDLRTVLEALADHAAVIKDADTLTELTRRRMARHVTARHREDDGAVYGLILDGQVEELFRPQPGHKPGSQLPEARAVPPLLRALEAAVREQGGSAHLPLLITAPDVRRSVAALVMRHVPGLAVISYREIEPSTPIRTTGVVTLRE